MFTHVDKRRGTKILPKLSSQLKWQKNYFPINGYDADFCFIIPMGWTPLVAVSRELSVFLVVGMWTSTSGSASVSCRHLWTGGGGKTLTFLVDVVSGLPVPLDLSFVQGGPSPMRP